MLGLGVEKLARLARALGIRTASKVPADRARGWLGRVSSKMLWFWQPLGMVLYSTEYGQYCTYGTIPAKYGVLRRPSEDSAAASVRKSGGGRATLHF